jgi:hypothetical protein
MVFTADVMKMPEAPSIRGGGERERIPLPRPQTPFLFFLSPLCLGHTCIKKLLLNTLKQSRKRSHLIFLHFEMSCSATTCEGAMPWQYPEIRLFVLSYGKSDLIINLNLVSPVMSSFKAFYLILACVYLKHETSTLLLMLFI